MRKNRGFVRGFPDRLKKALKEKDMTYMEFARRIGCDKKTVYNWIEGISSPDMVSIEKMCKILRVTSDYLIFGEKR